MSQVYDSSGHLYDAAQLTAPGTVNGQAVAAGWWVLTDPFGNRSVCAPDAFAAMFSTATGAAATPVPPADETGWSVLVDQTMTLLNLPAGLGKEWDFSGAQNLRELAADIFVAVGTSVTLTVFRRWNLNYPGAQVAQVGPLAANASGAADCGVGSNSGRLLGSPYLYVKVLNNDQAAAALVYVYVAGR